MKKIRYLIVLLLVFPLPLIADVIHPPYINFGTVLSFECIGSYEFPLTKLNTLNIWGGVGAVSLIQEVKNPAFGMEIALELRQYFKADKFEKFNIGLYAGVAYMDYRYFLQDYYESRNSIGFVPGLKLTFKERFNSWFVGEPYISLSTPIYDKNIGLVLTIGLRIGLNKVKINK